MEDMTLCESCGTEAIARVHTSWLCARCGLERMTTVAGLDATDGTRSAGTWRRAVRAAIGSGLTAKILIGAAALATVGGVVATESPPADTPPSAPPPVSTPVEPPDTPAPGPLPGVADDIAHAATTPGVVPADQGDAPDPDPADSPPQPSNVSSYVTALHEWTACMDEAVRQFATVRTAGGFDPFQACPDRPDPAAFDLGAAYGRPDAPGRPDEPGSQRDDAPGRPDDPGSQRNAAPGSPTPAPPD